MTEAELDHAPASRGPCTAIGLTVGAIGVVFGDIGIILGDVATGASGR